MAPNWRKCWSKENARVTATLHDDLARAVRETPLLIRNCGRFAMPVDVVFSDKDEVGQLAAQRSRHVEGQRAWPRIFNRVSVSSTM